MEVDIDPTVVFIETGGTVSNILIKRKIHFSMEMELLHFQQWAKMQGLTLPFIKTQICDLT